MSILNRPRLRPTLLRITVLASLSLLGACGRDSATATAPTVAASSPIVATPAAAPIYVCPMHPHITAHEPGTCPICGMDLVRKAAPAAETAEPDAATVTVSAAVRQTLGVRTAPALRRDVQPRVRVPARVIAEAGGELRLQSRVEGFVEKLHVASIGARVRAGAVIADLYAPALVEAQEEMLLGGEAAAPAAERLRRFGIAERDIAAVRAAGVSARTLPLRTPVGGVVTAIEVREGSRIELADVLAVIAARGGLRIEAQLFPAQRSLLGRDIDAHFSQPGVPDAHWRGRDPQWLDVVDPLTQTLGLRFRIDGDTALAPGTVLDAELHGEARAQVLLVPMAAVIRTDAGARVLREDGAGRYLPVAVRTGQRYGDDIEIVAGLEAQQRIVVSGQFLIDSEAQLQDALSRLQVGSADAGHGHD